MSGQSSTHSILLCSQWLVKPLAVFVEMLFSLFPFSCVEIWNQEWTFHICLRDRRWFVNREKWREPSMPSILELFLSHLQMFAKEVFWFNCSLLDYVIIAFEFFIRSFLSWSLGLRGACFWPLMYLKKSGYLYHCFFALILWLLLWGAFWCAELSFVRLLHGMSLWFIFVLGTNHPSHSLLLHIVMKAGYCWPVHLEDLCLLTAVQKIQYFNERYTTFAWMALQQLSIFPSGPFSWKKNLIIIIHLSREYSSHSAVSAFLMI